MKPSWNFARVGLGNEMNTCSRPSGCTGQSLTSAARQGHPFPLTIRPRLPYPDGRYLTKPPRRGVDGLHNLIADESENLYQVQEVCKDLQHRHEQRHLRREHNNAGIKRTSTGTRVKHDNLVLVKEADSTLHNDYVHVKLTHDRWTGPWTVTAVITPGLCSRVTLQGRREKVRRAAAAHIKPYHMRPPPLRHDFGDEYAHFAWGPDSGLGTASTLASPLYTLVDRCMIQLPNGSWEWRYRGRDLNDSLSGFIT